MQKNYTCISLICCPFPSPVPNPNKNRLLPKCGVQVIFLCFSGKGLRKKMPVINGMPSFKKHWS